jgi:hypothetical protein
VFSAQCLCGPDLDFGAAPNLFTIADPSTGRRRQVVGIGQKSGDYWALNPDTGAVIWRTNVGPADSAAASSLERRPTVAASTSPKPTAASRHSHWAAADPLPARR